MDPTKDNLDEQMAKLREALRDIDLTPEDLTITNSGAVSGTHGYESILSSDVADTITLSGYPYPNNNTVIGGGYTVNLGGMNHSNTGPYTVSTSARGFTFPNTASITANPWATNTTAQAGRMELNGDNADLVINGVSLLEVLRDRLNVMIPNPALEKEWDQLKELGDKYRELEAKLKEQGDMWSKLKSMPPPEPLI